MTKIEEALALLDEVIALLGPADSAVAPLRSAMWDLRQRTVPQPFTPVAGMPVRLENGQDYPGEIEGIGPTTIFLVWFKWGYVPFEHRTATNIVHGFAVLNPDDGFYYESGKRIVTA